MWKYVIMLALVAGCCPSDHKCEMPKDGCKTPCTQPCDKTKCDKEEPCDKTKCTKPAAAAPAAFMGIKADAHGPALACNTALSQADLDAVGYDCSKPLYLYMHWSPENSWWQRSMAYKLYWDQVATAPGVLALPYGRGLLDLDGDGDVDLQDFAILQANWDPRVK